MTVVLSRRPGGAGGGGGSPSGPAGGDLSGTYPNPSLADGLVPWALIHDETLAGAGTFDVASIPATFADLRILVNGRSAVASNSDWIRVRLNNDSGTNYDHRLVHETGNTTIATDVTLAASSVQWTVELPGTSSTAGWAGSLELVIQEYAGTTFHKIGYWNGGTRFATNEIRSATGSFIWHNTAAVNRVQLFSANGNFVAGTRLRIYGVA